jgi:hypothetical protein
MNLKTNVSKKKYKEKKFKVHTGAIFLNTKGNRSDCVYMVVPCGIFWTTDGTPGYVLTNISNGGTWAESGTLDKIEKYLNDNLEIDGIVQIDPSDFSISVEY